MNISLPRGEMLAALQSVLGAVERKLSLPILANVLLVVKDDELEITSTDLEIQLNARAKVQNISPGQVTVPARKFYDICRGLPEGATISMEQKENRLVVKAGRSRFTLATLPAEEFPQMAADQATQTLTLKSGELKDLLERVQFAMAHQDVRYYLNGVLLDMTPERLRAVATDGHRLAMAELSRDVGVAEAMQIIVPRKSVMEMQRLLESGEAQATLGISRNQIHLDMDGVKITSKLVDGRFPDYQRVIPSGHDKLMMGDRIQVRAALARAAILSNEKFRGVRFSVKPGTLTLHAQNPEQEEATEEVEIKYDGPNLEIGFNVSYLLDALDAVDGDEFALELKNAECSGLLYDPVRKQHQYVVMPMRV